MELSNTPDCKRQNHRLAIMQLVILLGFTIAVLFRFYYRGILQKAPYPYNSFLFFPADAFNDFFNILWGCWDGDPYNISKIQRLGGYFPLAYWIGYVFSYAIDCRWQFYGCIVGIFLAVLFYCNLKAFRSPQRSWIDTLTHACVFTLLPYPVLFVIDRGNFDILMFIFTAAFLSLYRRGYSLTCAIPFAITIAIKAYTGIFILLLLAEKRYRTIVFTALLVALMTLGSLATFHGGFQANVDQYIASSKAGVALIGDGRVYCFSSSLCSLLFVCGHFFGISLNNCPEFFRFYTLFTICVPFLLLAHFIWVEKTEWRRVALTVLVMILLPYSSGDYRLLFLFFPIWLFIQKKEVSRYDSWYALLFGLAIIPKPWFIFLIPGILNNVFSTNSILNPIILMLLVGLLLAEGWRERCKTQAQENKQAFPLS
ncbi:TPA: hypothetical protein DDW35_12405 [Candidatus Sumerlaeota bacterium]|nr:hypothetical protein [Candidatus Sumerlaeota bacterium]